MAASVIPAAPAVPVYEASPLKRRARRTKAEMAALDDALCEIVEQHQPLGVRQCFYLAVSNGLVPKVDTYAGYGIVQRRVLAMRRDGRIPYQNIIDESRFVMGRPSYGDLGEYIERAVQMYRRDLWIGTVRVQVWCEKLSIAGLLLDVADPWTVPVYPARGFAGEPLVWADAQQIDYAFRAGLQRTAILYVGDWDPSGALMDADIERRLRRLGADAGLAEFRRIAVTEEQIMDWGLPTRPTKRTGTHAKGFLGRSVEVEAVPPERLRELLEKNITRYIDPRKVEVVRAIEAEERKALQMFAARVGRPDQRHPKKRRS